MARIINSLISKYHKDMGVHKAINLNFSDFFDYVKKLRYSRDFPRPEIISRVKYYNRLDGWDCKKKSVLLGSYCKFNGIPYRLVISSNDKNKDFHHIFVQVKLNNKWVNADCTYDDGKIAKPKSVGKFMVIGKRG
ncbi:MAG: hypothetical protein GY793_10330 [Proteobacteria bacterium]|nr:hypothetical protein [Pseudomonadota bacterium]